MKIPYLIPTLAILATIVVGFVIYNEQKTIDYVVETTTSTTTSTNVSEVPSPLTLASLQALPEWNPTMEVEGMVRVEDGVAELAVKGYSVHTEDLSWTGGIKTSAFVIKYTEPEVNVDACKKYGLTGEPSGYLSGYICPIATPDLFNEIIITSKDTGEVLHKYKLGEGYSLLNSKYQSEGPIMIVNPVHGSPHLMVVYMSKWGDIKDKDNLELIHYYVDLLTGKIQKGKEFESAPTSI